MLINVCLTAGYEVAVFFALPWMKRLLRLIPIVRSMSIHCDDYHQEAVYGVPQPLRIKRGVRKKGRRDAARPPSKTRKKEEPTHGRIPRRSSW
jgi:hypothetical protein